MNFPKELGLLLTAARPGYICGDANNVDELWGGQ